MLTFQVSYPGILPFHPVECPLLHNDPSGINVKGTGGLGAKTSLFYINGAFEIFLDAFQNILANILEIVRSTQMSFQLSSETKRSFDCLQKISDDCKNVRINEILQGCKLKFQLYTTQVH